ncbi:MAG TPA: hypothetical protein VNP98_10180 [Chthoniobacterales bacterium]|nr:hypothetical protein [Chthoniobacterales bacterium]
MLPIFNFCQQQFALVQDNNVTVGRLQDLAGQHGVKPFVFFDSDHREAACVIPTAVEWAIEEFNLDAREIAAETGIFEVLRRNQAVVHRAQPASRIAQLASSQHADAIVTVGDLGKPVGVFFPGIVAERLSETRIVRDSLSRFLQTQIRALGNIDHLADAIRVLEKEGIDFHSEQLNLYGAEPYMCQADGGHFRNSCPCPDHPGASCGRVNLA